MKEIFKAGDKVFDMRYGWGIVFDVYTLGGSKYPVFVVFGDGFYQREYTSDGIESHSILPTLSFTEYTLSGFSQERI